MKQQQQPSSKSRRGCYFLRVKKREKFCQRPFPPLLPNDCYWDHVPKGETEREGEREYNRYAHRKYCVSGLCIQQLLTWRWRDGIDCKISQRITFLFILEAKISFLLLLLLPLCRPVMDATVLGLKKTSCWLVVVVFFFLSVYVNTRITKVCDAISAGWNNDLRWISGIFCFLS